MNITSRQIQELFELLGHQLDGDLSEADARRLEQLLEDHSALHAYYVKYFLLSAELKSCLCNPLTDSYEEPDQDMPVPRGKPGDSHWKNVAEQERIKQYAEETLQQFKIEERHHQETLLEKQDRAQRRRQMIIVSSLAALISIVLFTWLSPVFRSEPSSPTPLALPMTPPIVATIAQSVDAQWALPDFSVAVGTRMRASSISLQRGLVQIVFDDGAEVILQAPCDLVLKTAGQMVLNRGAVSVVVPPRAVGFAIQTPTGIITDHGTEFGVITQDSGATETHVYKGKVVLASVSGISQGVDPVALLQGQAAAVDETGQVRRTPFRAHTIVREMPEEGGFAVPGERLSLADVVGGGNGFGTGELGYGIDPVLGRFGTGFRYDNQRKGNGRYALVPAMPLVDGVFVADGEYGPLRVSSMDHRFLLCPDTTGSYYRGVVNGGRMRNAESKTFVSSALKDQPYGSLANPVISMHANLGVTFDLDAIRDTLPGLRILRFESLCGIAPGVPPMVGKGNAMTAFKPGDSTIPSWVTYNDLSDLNGGTVALGRKVATYGYWHAKSSPLVDFDTGALLAVTVTGEIVGDNSANWDTHGTSGTNCDAGTDANDVFGGILDLTGVSELDDVNEHKAIIFNGLDPEKRYTVTLTANRGNPSYTDRWTRVTIEGADAYTYAASAGVEKLSEDAGEIWVGDNTVSGHVMKWTGIACGVDGRFSIKSENAGRGAKGYAMMAFKLEEFTVPNRVADRLGSTAASFWVLVDGQVRFAQRSIRQEDGDIAVMVELQDEDRFLTLAATDDGVVGNNDCLFAEPALTLASATEREDGGEVEK